MRKKILGRISETPFAACRLCHQQVNISQVPKPTVDISTSPQGVLRLGTGVIRAMHSTQRVDLHFLQCQGAMFQGRFDHSRGMSST